MKNSHRCEGIVMMRHRASIAITEKNLMAGLPANLTHREDGQKVIMEVDPTIIAQVDAIVADGVTVADSATLEADLHPCKSFVAMLKQKSSSSRHICNQTARASNATGKIVGYGLTR